MMYVRKKKKKQEKINILTNSLKRIVYYDLINFLTSHIIAKTNANYRSSDINNV